MSHACDLDYLVIGGGFYGTALALFLRSLSKRTCLVEAGDALMQRASRVNQARVHTGFHYPRNALTAVKSLVLHQRFARDFRSAVVDDFDMLYGVARYRSRVSAKRFWRMFRNMGAPISVASSSQAALFSHDTIEGVFACREHAFDADELRRIMEDRLGRADVDVRLGTRVEEVSETEGRVVVVLSDGTELRARYVFNVSYANVNQVLAKAGLPSAPLKYEIAEIALVTPPRDLAGVGITVMDGPFFSVMPFPSEGTYSLTHVRYTPHKSWCDSDGASAPDDMLAAYPGESQVRHMIGDARRYVPSMADCVPQHSLFEVKTVLLKNEKDDGRPILFQRLPANSRIISVMGGKIDNIYDLFDLVRATDPEWSSADVSFLLPQDLAA